jgi:hypothetical protein
VQLEGEMVVHEKFEYILLELHGVGGECANELHLKSMFFGQLMASHGPFIVAL